VELRSFKLRVRDTHVRVVPKTDALGCPFAGPGADLFGADAEEAFRLAEPLLSALVAFEPGVVVRSLAVDLERPRVTATLDPTVPDADPRARVVRLDDGPMLRGLVRAADPLIAYLIQAAARCIAARGLPASETS
jgi:hypothetical protein